MLEAMNLAIFIGAALVVAAVFTSLVSFRFGAPLLLVFLLVGLLAGEDGIGGIDFDNARAAYFIGSIALAIILFDSGFETRFSTLRIAALPAGLLATVGVLVTAGLVSLVAQLLFGLSPLVGFLLGAIVAPTDAAAVFFLLRVGGLSLRDRVRSTLEVESGTNDPVAIFLTLSLVEMVAGPISAGGVTFDLLSRLLLQAGIGLAGGLAGGLIIVEVVRRTELEDALYPIIVLAMALAVYALTALAEGSGFLAVYVAGVIAGNARMRRAVLLRRFQQGATWLSQIAMFLTLGLLATPSQFGGVIVPALILAAFLTFFARPVAVWLCLLPFRFSRQEVAFVSWVGLRGAVSILLAILPIMAGMPEGRTLFNTAFVVVLASLLVQGWTIGPVARFLGIVVPGRRGPVDRIELELPGRGDHEIVAYVVHPESAVGKGHRIPRWARPSLVVRDGHALRPHRFGRPEAGDQVYVIVSPEYVRLVDRLFAAPDAGSDDPQLFGEFAIEPETRLTDLAAAYGAKLASADGDLTVAELLRRELAGDIERGDRVPYGPVDLIVRRVSDDHVIEEIGLAMEHGRRQRPTIPLFQTGRELKDLARRWFAKRPPPLPVTPAVAEVTSVAVSEPVAPAEGLPPAPSDLPAVTVPGELDVPGEAKGGSGV